MVQRFRLALVCGLLLWTPSGFGAEEGFFDSNGVKIHYLVQGQGEPVLLIHGFAVNDQLQWVMPGISRALAKDYQVIMYDNRGHGRSGKPHDAKQYGQEMVDDVVRLLDHLKIPRAHVVGYSMGGFITLKLLTLHPERFLTATLGGAGQPQTQDLRFVAELADSLDQGKGFRPLLERLTPKGQPKPTEEQMKGINQMISTFNDVKALAATVRGFKDFTIVEDKLKTNQVPTLALIGVLDPLKEGVDDLKGRMANLKVVGIDGADHMNAFYKPEFVKGLREFLGQHSQNGNGKKAETVPADKHTR
jgi:pimeloyl-ACP methyl ester carboxylesterase